MKFAVSMLRDHVDTRLTAEEIGDLLTMAGFELEGIEEVDGEPVLDIKVVSNRGDGLSVVGLTREILAKDPESRPTDLYVRATRRFEDVSLTGENPATITIESSHCNRFALMSISKIQNGEASPTIRRRLEQAGMRSISLLVDLTNYVMLELGQPLHAFDVEKLGLHVVVRQAQAGERLVTLNGVENELQPNQLVIATPDRSVGVAGVMGGLDTEVSASTTHALIESAHFLNTSVRKTRKQLGLNTEASYRFERSVDPDGVTAALRRFAELLLEHQPGAVISTILDDYPRPPKEIEIDLDLERANRLLGLQIPAASAVRYLTSLGFRVAGHGDPFLVVPPSWRTDIKREEDLVEELGRVHGYELIPELLPEGQTVPGGVNGAFYLLDRITDRLLALGYHQALSHSLRGVHALDAVGERVGPRNPGSPDTAFLRNSLIPGLSDAAHRNGSKDQFWFEIGKVFTPNEARSVAILASGALLPPGVNEKAETPADFYAAKAAVEDILAAIGVSAEFQPTDQDARLHPFRQAAIGEFGVIGEIHPALAAELGLADRTVVAELNLERLLQQDSPDLKVKSFSRHPAVRRDVAVLVKQTVPFKVLQSTIWQAAGPVLELLWVFDVFRGPGIPEDSQSVGIGMLFRKPDSTFTDEEANQVRDEIAAALQSVGATLR